MSDFDVDQHDVRAHERAQLLAICRYLLAAIALVVGAFAWRCDHADAQTEADKRACAIDHGITIECQRWTQ